MFQLEILTTSNDGTVRNPQSPDDWKTWVSATATRNFVTGDPLIDWLSLFGKAKGHMRDDELPDHDNRLDFTNFLFRKGLAFERHVVSHLSGFARPVTVGSFKKARDLEAAVMTAEAMRDGVEWIYQGVLRNPENQTYGLPDFIVRLDALMELFPSIKEIEKRVSGLTSADSATKSQYRILDVKYTTLYLKADDTLDSKSRAYKVQLDVYNRALGRLLGSLPKLGYILGRSWRSSKERGESGFERLGPIRLDEDISKGRTISEATDSAVEWIRKLRSEGGSWDVTPSPSVQELYPNMSNSRDYPWHAAKGIIARDLEELTLVSNVSPANRSQAHAAGVFRYSDPRSNSDLLGITGVIAKKKVDRLLTINQSTESVVTPTHIDAGQEVWRAGENLEFFVDFETVNDLNDDFAEFPDRGGQQLIFMIGCGHLENGEWQFDNFVANRLSENSEAGMVDKWIGHMAEVAKRMDAEPVVYHWSNAERSNLDTAYNATRSRHPDRNWPQINWFDLHSRVFKLEPVGINGAFGFGLKSVAKALKSHGLIETGWGDSQVDGMGAMTAAWWSQDVAVRYKKRLIDSPIMHDVKDYNEVDCKVMMEIVQYLRSHH